MLIEVMLLQSLLLLLVWTLETGIAHHGSAATSEESR